MKVTGQWGWERYGTLEGKENELQKTYTPKNGVTMICRHGDCSLKIMDFGIIELEGGQSTGFSTEDREVGFVILSGEADFSFGNTVSGVRSAADVLFLKERLTAYICHAARSYFDGRDAHGDSFRLLPL